MQAMDAGRFGLLSPHIDYPRGGSVYAQVWHQAAEAVSAAELVILLGTDHYGDDPFTLTRQDYATPYGVLPTAQRIVDNVAGVLGEEVAFSGELRHRGEHSLELVAVWLHHMRQGKPVEVVPILAGSYYGYIMNGASPDSDHRTNLVLNALRSAGKSRRTAVIASGDLSHVGTAFGGSPLTAAARAEVRADDDELIGHMRRANATGFFESIRRVRDRNNVCGVSSFYLMMRLLGATQGELHGYASCPADSNDTSAVTICGMLFH
jgi:MEMO1 family protein